MDSTFTKSELIIMVKKSRIKVNCMIFLKDLVCSTLGGLYLISLMHDDVRIIIRELLFKLRLPSF